MEQLSEFRVINWSRTIFAKLHSNEVGLKLERKMREKFSVSQHILKLICHAFIVNDNCCTLIYINHSHNSLEQESIISTETFQPKIVTGQSPFTSLTFSLSLFPITTTIE